MKRIIITGASEGIGRALALRLATEDTHLCLLARNEEKLATVVSEVEAAGGKAFALPLDVQETAAVEQAVSQAVEQLGGLDVLVNNAGVWQKMSQLEEVEDAALEGIMRTNLIGPMVLTKRCLPHLRESNQAAVINVVSKSGVTAQAGQSVYTASKWGLKGFTDVLREDLKEAGIRVGGIYQSGTATDMFAKTNEEVPKEKFTDPADLADTIAFMLNQPDKIWLNEVHVTY